MAAEVETFSFIKVVPCADADGVAIREGSVLREINDGERGVVTCIVRKESRDGPPLSQIGDLGIETRAGTTRVSNRYNQWRHIPHDEQTYRERFVSWMHRPYHHEDDRGISKDEGLAIDGIMNLLPDTTVDWDHGPWPDKLEAALKFLVGHLEDTKP